MWLSGLSGGKSPHTKHLYSLKTLRLIVRNVSRFRTAKIGDHDVACPVRMQERQEACHRPSETPRYSWCLVTRHRRGFSRAVARTRRGLHSVETLSLSGYRRAVTPIPRLLVVLTKCQCGAQSVQAKLIICADPYLSHDVRGASQGSGTPPTPAPSYPQAIAVEAARGRPLPPCCALLVTRQTSAPS